MSNSDQHLPFLSVLKQAERSRVTYYACFAHCLGNDVTAALFASNFWFWEGKQSDEDGWIYKDRDEITKETGLARKAQEGARQRLKDYGILEEWKGGLPCRLHYRFNWHVLDALLVEHFKEMERGEPSVETKEPIMDVMKRIFDDAYAKQTGGAEFNWGTKSERGKYFGNLKRLHDALAQEVANRKTQDAAKANGGMTPAGFNATATYEEILVSWQVFLDRLPDWHRTKRLRPDHLLSDFNTIVLEIRNNAPLKQKPAARTGTDNTFAI